MEKISKFMAMVAAFMVAMTALCSSGVFNPAT